MGKEGIAVMRAGGGFRVVLNAEDREVLVPDAGDGLIVEIVFSNDRAAPFEGFLS